MNKFEVYDHHPVDIERAVRRGRALRSEAFGRAGARLRARLDAAMKSARARRARRRAAAQLALPASDGVFEIDKRVLSDCRHLL